MEERLNKWKGYDPELIDGPDSEFMDIGEKQFRRCVDFVFAGSYPDPYWIKEELDKLNEKKLREVEFICGYKTYLKNEIVNDKMLKRLSIFFACNHSQISQIKTTKLIKLINVLSDFHNEIISASKILDDIENLKFRIKRNKFKILTFEEYKEENIEKEILDKAIEVPANQMLLNHGYIEVEPGIFKRRKI